MRKKTDTKTKVISKLVKSEIKIVDYSWIYPQVQTVNNENHNIKTVNVTFMPQAFSFISHYSVFVCISETLFLLSRWNPVAPKVVEFLFHLRIFFFFADAIKWNDALMKFAWRNIYFKMGMVCNSLQYSCCFTNEFSSQRIQTTAYFFQHSAIHILTKNTSNVVFNHNLFNDSMVLTAFAFI